MELGILGGTFDPPHRGHCVLADQCVRALGLARVWFVPAFHPPHKLGRALTPFDLRLEMIRAATAADARFEVLETERHRGGVSYTVDTLRDLTRDHPGETFWLLLGEDSLADLAGWKDPEQIARLARLAVYRRPGTRSAIPAHLRRCARFVEGPPVDVSSTELRASLGRQEPVGDRIDPSVFAIIERERLYGWKGPEGRTS